MTDSRVLDALRQIEWRPVLDLDSVWADDVTDEPSLTGGLIETLEEQWGRETAPGKPRPLGWTLIGRAGVGKTHTLGRLRQRVWRRGGWFVLFDLLDVNDFWATAAVGTIDSLWRRLPSGATQGHALIEMLCATLGMPSGTAETLRGSQAKAWTDAACKCVTALQARHPGEALKYRNVYLALMALFSGHDELRINAHAWLLSEKADGAGQAIKADPIPSRSVVGGLSWLMSLTGPMMIGLDQIDAIVSESNMVRQWDAEDAARLKVARVIEGLAGGLMDVIQITSRCVTVVTALEATWEIMRERATQAFPDRFQIKGLSPIKDALAAEAIVSKRLGPAYVSAGFDPPYPTWPFPPRFFSAFQEARPRELLQRCAEYIDQCVVRGIIEEWTGDEGSGAATRAASVQETHSVGLDRRYAELRSQAPPVDAADELLVAPLLVAALTAFLRQAPPEGEALVESSTAGLDARLRRGDAEGREIHHCFRIVGSPIAVAFQSRLKAAIAAAGIDRALPFRHLIVVRDGPVPSGTKTAALTAQFESAGGRFVPLDTGDCAAFWALRQLLAEKPTGLEAWLRGRRPVDNLAFFRAVGLAGAPLSAFHRLSQADPLPTPPAPPAPAVPPEHAARRPAAADAPAPPASPAIPLGRRVGDGELVTLPLTLLPRHTLVIGGSGSGKTVFLRRVIEEATLAGVPSIVIDSNNDLVTLGDAWPNRPATFTDEDADKAARYARAVDLIVWTPGRRRGNPIALAPLPDFAAIDDEEDRETAVALAAVSLESIVPLRGARGGCRRGCCATRCAISPGAAADRWIR